jgi:serine/threonine protein kinase
MSNTIPKIIKSASHYAIIREIAEGGMGKVYEAEQRGAEGFSKRVAIKTLLSNMYNDKRFIEMFISEAKLVSNLVHENIVQIYHLDKASFGHYIVMELINGIALHDLIDKLKSKNLLLPPPLAVFICARIARGLAHAHNSSDAMKNNLNIVHRDVCPNNILITQAGLPKLTDFGIAKARSNTLTANDHLLMGKLIYMAPEQARKHETDQRVDLYALGMVLFELLSGQLSRDADTDSELLELACAGAVNMDALPKNLDPDLLKILFRSIQVEPDDRYQTAGEMATALEYFIYKDGYGPTVVSLETFMRKYLPEMYN